MSAELPQEINRDYSIERELGAGGQGRSLLGRRRSDGKQVVVKLLDFVVLSSWKDLELLQREIKVLRALNHPAIPRLIAHHPEDPDGEEPDAFVVVQEYVEGRSLDDILTEEEGAILNEDGARLFLDELLGVLEYLHSFNPPVVHRDIKPSNIIRRPDGSHSLIDFGAASASGILTGSTTFVGTNGYMPPEQLMGRAEPRSDMFALGATVLELMTGINPSNLSHEDLSFRLDVVEASPEFINILRVLTHPSPARRYMSAERARRALSDPAAALVLGRESPSGLEVERRADGRVMVSLPPAARLWLVFPIAFLLFIGFLSFTAILSPWSLIIGTVLVFGLAVKTTSNARIELDDQELRLWRDWGPIHRSQRWELESIAEVWSGPVPTKTGILIQARDGTQAGIRFGSLTPAQHHWLGDLIRNHKEGR